MKFAEHNLKLTITTPDGLKHEKILTREQLYSSVSCGQRPEGGLPGFKWQGHNFKLPEDLDDRVACPENLDGFCPHLGNECPVLPLTLMSMMNMDDDEREVVAKERRNFPNQQLLATLSYLTFGSENGPVELSLANFDIVRLIHAFFPPKLADQVTVDKIIDRIIPYTLEWVPTK